MVKWNALFAKKDINESAIFCPNCGQLLENNLRFQSVDNYWDDINTKTKKEIENHEREIYEKKNQNEKFERKIFKVFSFAWLFSSYLAQYMF